MVWYIPVYVAEVCVRFMRLWGWDRRQGVGSKVFNAREFPDALCFVY